MPPQVLLCAGLLSRRDWVLDEAYTQRYLGSTPPGAPRSYNDLSNEALRRPGWRRYQSPELGMKPVLSAALAFTFDETEVGGLWVVGGAEGGDEAQRTARSASGQSLAAVPDRPIPGSACPRLPAALPLQENLELTRQLAAELAQLWAALVAQGQREAAAGGGCGLHEAETVRRYDARYIKCECCARGRSRAPSLRPIAAAHHVHSGAGHAT